MKIYPITFFSFIWIAFAVFSCNTEQEKEETPLKINQIQVIGTHNSYKEAIDPPIMAQLMELDSNQAKSLDYSHPPLDEQLSDGMRKLEIDVFYDPVGGKYSYPVGLKDLKAAGMEVKELDTAMMNQPGFKVLHVQDIDFRSNCPTLSACLQEILDWSEANPNHVPIAISFNTKSQVIESRPDFTKPLPFTPTAFDSLDAEILTVIPKTKIITPDEVKGDYSTLEEAALAHNWPTLASSRGKFIFVLNAGKSHLDAYSEGHPSLKNRLMFVSVSPGQPEAAFVFQNNPIGNIEKIQELVKAGYLVRTRADAGTKEARLGDYSRFEAALASGAHFISTDYEFEDKRFGTGYHIQLTDGKAAICNPVLNLASCKKDLVE